MTAVTGRARWLAIRLDSPDRLARSDLADGSRCLFDRFWVEAAEG